jgi:hypothetical protein
VNCHNFTISITLAFFKTEKTEVTKCSSIEELLNYDTSIIRNIRQPSEVYPRSSKLVKHLKMNQYVTIGTD